MPHSHKPMTVLLLDDDAAFARIVQHHLQKYPDREFTLIWKKTVEDALAEVRQNNAIELILTDYQLPASNGFEFCLQLNQMNSSIPIIFLTATRDIKLAVEAMKLGVEDFLVKDELIESILPRTIINVYEKVKTRQQIAAVEKRMLIAEKRAEAIRQLVVTVCHEFNNPLAAIKISADLIQRQAILEDDKKLLEEFEKDFSHIEQEIKKLRDISFERFDFHAMADSSSGSPSPQR